MNGNFHIIILTILLTMFSTDSYSQKILFIGDQNSESDSAYAFLTKINPLSERGDITDIYDNYSIIWLHLSDTTKPNLSPKTREQLKNFLNSGGSLFLTLEAFQLLNELDIESNQCSLKYVTALDQGYGRKLGIHSFLDHSLFKGLNGGAYIWNPVVDTTTRMWGFFGEENISGKTIAVDWAYIRLRENSRIVVEYNVGKGKVLAVGAYTHFKPENFHKEHLKKFITNCIDYLSEVPGLVNHYWDYSSKRVEFVEEPKLNSSFSPSSSWKELNTLKMDSRFASDNYWDLAGERTLIMGKEKGGIEEIWIHPFMSFRDYEVGIQFSDNDSINWLNNERPGIEVTPAYFKRIYNFRRAFLIEFISADPENPVGVIHYQYRGVYPAKLYIKVKSNLRLMWPYSENVFRSLNYSLTGNIFRVTTDSGILSSALGISKSPVYSNTGQYQDFVKEDSVFKGIPSDNFQAAVIFKIELNMNDNLDVVFSGSSVSKNETENNLISASSNPYNIYSRSVDYINNFLQNNLSIKTPDSEFDEGFNWALIGSDKFFTNTPGIGKSLTAGYSTTARGWDGEHKISGRPGYGWYFGRDAEWSGFALLDYGDFIKVKDILSNFNKYQDLNGKIYHELTTSGVVHYDAADATPLYIILAGRYLRYSGDLNYIKDNWDYLKKAIDFCYSTDTDGDKLIENTNVGHGWVEGGSLYGSHTTLYLASCWAEALKEAAYLTGALGFEELKNKYSNDYAQVKSIINNDFWNESDNFYYYGKLNDGSFNSEKTILPSVALYFELTDPLKVNNILKNYATSNFSSDWGVRILSSANQLYNPSGYHYGSAWPLFTGWTSLAEYKYGRYIQGYTHLRNNLNIYKSFSKGYIEEVLNGAVYKPSGVCPHQCWSETMVLQPVIEGLLGYKPDALNHKVELSPRFPANWNFAEIKNIKCGSDNISMIMKKQNGILTYQFLNTGNILIKLRISLPHKTIIENLTLKGNATPYKLHKEIESIILETEFKLNGNAKLDIVLKEGFTLLPSVTSPVEGDSTSGIKIISTSFDNDVYDLFLEGYGGNEYELSIYSPHINIYNSDKELQRKDKDTYILKVAFEGESGYYSKNIRLRVK